MEDVPRDGSARGCKDGEEQVGPQRRSSARGSPLLVGRICDDDDVDGAGGRGMLSVASHHPLHTGDLIGTKFDTPQASCGSATVATLQTNRDKLVHNLKKEGYPVRTKHPKARK